MMASNWRTTEEKRGISTISSTRKHIKRAQCNQHGEIHGTNNGERERGGHDVSYAIKSSSASSSMGYAMHRKSSPTSGG